MDSRAIGVFDSGVGGLTVARALMDRLPGESIVYFGDTARGPYGPRAAAEVRAFAADIAAALVAEDVKMLVAACNSASSAGLEHVREAYPSIPLLEVVEPAVRAAVAATRNGRIGVVGTALTIASGAYERAAASRGAHVLAAACPRFVEFVERGETAGSEILGLAADYLAPLVDAGIDTLVLGCTHYPLLAGVIRAVVGGDVVLISSAEETAKDAFTELTRRDMFAPGAGAPAHRFLCSGDAAAFGTLAVRFLGPEAAAPEERRFAEVPWT